LIAVDTNVLVYAHRREATEHAALCLAHGVEALLRRDRDFSLFPELVRQDPFA
jgi:predicted nucleic acid-binding protein